MGDVAPVDLELAAGDRDVRVDVAVPGRDFGDDEVHAHLVVNVWGAVCEVSTDLVERVEPLVAQELVWHLGEAMRHELDRHAPLRR